MQPSLSKRRTIAACLCSFYPLRACYNDNIKRDEEATRMNAELVAPKAKQSSIWGQKPFVMLLLTSLFLNIGGQIYQLAMPLLMYEMTQSAVMMSNMRIAEYLPNLLLGLVVGVLVDRVNKKRWIMHMIFWQILMLLFYVALWMVVNWGASSVFAAAAVVNVLLFGGLVKTALWKTR
jgi:Na+/melibiose symporter-like transporter